MEAADSNLELSKGISLHMKAQSVVVRERFTESEVLAADTSSVCYTGAL